MSAMILVGILEVCFMGTHRDPPHRMVEQSYFKCEASRSLVGGIWGKGPFKRMGPESACRKSDWVKIEKKAFRELATEWHGVDWSKEIPFWSRD